MDEIPYSLPSEAPLPEEPNRGVVSRLRDAARLALFRRIPEARLKPTSLEIVAAVLLTLCVPTLLAVITLGADGQFALGDLPETLFHVPLLLLAVAVAARILRRDDAIPSMLFAALLAWFAVDVASEAIWWVLDALDFRGHNRILRLALIYIPVTWAALAATRFALSIQQQGILSRTAVFLAYAMFVVLPFTAVTHDRSLWQKDWSKEAAANPGPRYHVAEEEAFYRQPELLARELAAVEPGRKGTIDVFFVGMAGYGAQGVFAREVDSVAKLMQDRFGAKGHIVKLENSPNGILSNPIASTTSLRAALKRAAESMDVDEDVLVLFLTSHGSTDFKFSLELWPMQFKPLDPATLRAILDESGIRNRVVVISACYSGGFVDKLRDDRTLVITAAAADKNSFGCDNKADWTYFGRAYFDEALRKTFSFTKAFELAKPVIEAREKAEHFDPSQPQMAAGTLIQAKLDALAAQLEQGASPSTAMPVGPGARDDIFSRYVELTFSAPFLERMKQSCLESMRTSSPDAWLQKDPNTFGGLDKGSPYWSRMSAAWNRYADEYCTKMSDRMLLRNSYEQQVREAMTEADIKPVLQFLASGAGKRWYEKQREVEEAQTKQLSRISDEMSTAGYRRYMDEQASIFAEFRKDRQGSSQRPPQ